MNIDLRHLKLLHALRQHGSLAAAAQQLCLTPSAVSHQLKELEQTLETPVLGRRSKPLQFSAVGMRLLRLADEVLPLLQTAHGDILRLLHGQTGRIMLASECHSCFDWLMPLLNHYRQEFPDVDLDFSSGFEINPHELLLNGEFDVLITADNLSIDGLAYLPLFEYEARLIVSPQHDLARAEQITLADLSQEILISYPVDTHRLDIMRYGFLPAQLQPKSIRHCEHSQMLIQLVASGRGIAVLPDWVAQEYQQKGWIATRRLDCIAPQGLRRTLFAAYREGEQQRAFFAAFLQVLQRFSQQRRPFYDDALQ